MTEKYWVVIDKFNYSEGMRQFNVVSICEKESVARAEARKLYEEYLQKGFKVFGDEHVTILTNRREEIEILVLNKLVSYPAQ